MTYVVWFVVAIAILVAVHEFGHYWVARKLGVKVLRFSIGFGRPLLSWTGKGPDRTEYVISALPLGGYVKMLDEREGNVPAHDLHRAFNRQPVPNRMAVLGNPAEEVAAFARDRNADLIISGSRGFGKFKSPLLGSTSHKIAQLAECSCLTVK